MAAISPKRSTIPHCLEGLSLFVVCAGLAFTFTCPGLCIWTETITKEDWEAHVKDHTEKVKEVEEKYKKKLGDAGVCLTW